MSLGPRGHERAETPWNVGAPAHTRVMAQLATALQWVDGIARAAVGAVDELVRETGSVPPPAVHMFAEDVEPPYVGYVTRREFYRVPDAPAAIAELGILPSVLAATRLVVTWEHADLCTALELPGGPFPPGVVVLDAPVDGAETLRWYPFRLDAGPLDAAGAPTVVPVWSDPVQHQDPVLPDPLRRLLAVWREWRQDDIEQAAARLTAAGYRISWAQRS